MLMDPSKGRFFPRVIPKIFKFDMSKGQYAVAKLIGNTEKIGQVGLIVVVKRLNDGDNFSLSANTVDAAPSAANRLKSSSKLFSL